MKEQISVAEINKLS